MSQVFLPHEWQEAPSLAEAPREKKMARCPVCFTMYRDDVETAGSIESPCCPPACFERGFKVKD